LTSALCSVLVMRDKPPEAHTGGFGEPTCMECHIGEDPNHASGRLALLGLPAMYDAGRTYRLTLLVTRPELDVAGFQLAARFAEGTVRGQQAGVFASLDARADTSISTVGIHYLHHTMAGTAAVRDTARWTFEWRAPNASGGSIDVHFAANAANDDASPLGDHIFFGSLRVRPRAEK